MNTAEGAAGRADDLRPVCVLVGPPGAGKSTVGALVAEALGVPMRDADTDIEVLAGKPIPEIFIDDGEDHFRSLEKIAVGRALKTFSGVLALGGGAILAEETRTALRRQTVVYLSVELADAIARVGLGQGRPLLTVSPRATMKYLLDRRRPLYQQVATVTVHTDGRTPDEVAAEVLRVLDAGVRSSAPGAAAGSPQAGSQQAGSQQAGSTGPAPDGQSGQEMPG